MRTRILKAYRQSPQAVDILQRVARATGMSESEVLDECIFAQAETVLRWANSRQQIIEKFTRRLARKTAPARNRRKRPTK